MSNQYGDLPAGWEQQILAAIGAPATAANIQFLDAWNQVEHGPGGGGPNPVDAFNPFNTTQPAPGSTATNSAGVQSYPDWATGLAATAATLTQHYYVVLLAQLRSGAATAAQLGANPELNVWGTGTFNPSNYATTPSMAQSSSGGILAPLGGVASGIQATGGAALGWVGATFGKWLVLIGLGLAGLVLLHSLLKGGAAQQIGETLHHA